MNIKRILKRKKKTFCPVCGKYEFTEKFEICSVCGWENDPVQLKEPDLKGGANKMSLNEAIIKYKDGRND